MVMRLLIGSYPALKTWISNPLQNRLACDQNFGKYRKSATFLRFLKAGLAVARNILSHPSIGNEVLYGRLPTTKVT